MGMHFELIVDGANREELEEIYSLLRFEFHDCQDYTEGEYTSLTGFLIPEHTFTVYDAVDWNYYGRLIGLSKEYPNAFFTLYLDDGHYSLWEANQWIVYFKNGESQSFGAELYFPENPFRTAGSQG